MLVTINTDASFYDENKAGWAFWISSDKGRYKKFGKFKDSVENCTQAEIMCVINALHFCRNHPDLCTATKIIVNTDCKTCIQLAHNTGGLAKKDAQKRMRQLRGLIQQYIGKYKGRKCEYEFRHVKAHKKIENSREYVNDWVDKHAKKGAKL